VIEKEEKIKQLYYYVAQITFVIECKILRIVCINTVAYKKDEQYAPRSSGSTNCVLPSVNITYLKLRLLTGASSMV